MPLQHTQRSPIDGSGTSAQLWTAIAVAQAGESAVAIDLARLGRSAVSPNDWHFADSRSAHWVDRLHSCLSRRSRLGRRLMPIRSRPYLRRLRLRAHVRAGCPRFWNWRCLGRQSYGGSAHARLLQRPGCQFASSLHQAGSEHDRHDSATAASIPPQARTQRGGIAHANGLPPDSSPSPPPKPAIYRPSTANAVVPVAYARQKSAVKHLRPRKTVWHHDVFRLPGRREPSRPAQRRLLDPAPPPAV